MTVLRRLTSIASWILRRNHAEQRLDDEIRSFVEMSTAEKIREGVSSAEARRLALAEVGGIERMKESVRAGRHGALLDDIGRDVRYAFRLFVRQRTFASVIVATLALGIGANTAIFSIIDGLLLRTLPVGDPDTIQPTKEPGSPAIEIVGLVADAVYRDVREPTLPTAYVPLSQSIARSLVEDPTVTSAPAIVTLSVRAASGQPGPLRNNVAAAVGEINPTLALTFEPLEDRVSGALTPRAAARDSVSVIRPPGAGNRGRGPLWRHVVCGERAPGRDRRSHGARRDARLGHSSGARSRVMADGRRDCRGTRPRRRGVAFRVVAALRSRAGRPGHTRRLRRDIGAHRRRCWMASGAPRLASRPDSRPRRLVRPPVSL